MALRFNKAGQNVGIRAQNLSENVPMPRQGCCPFCSQWESELNKDGFCHDDQCRRGRQLVALARGSALVWVDLDGEVKPERKEYVELWVENKKSNK